MGVSNLRFEVFRAGKQTDSAGNQRDWTEADLDKIASSYDPENHEAPICIGHPKDNAPAWGWVKKVVREGKSLFAEVGDVQAEFSDMLKRKLFKKRSISLYPDMSLRHIGFLGAQPPAVKGLKDFAFSDAAGTPMEYMDWQTSNIFKAAGRLFQGLRDAMIADKKDVAEVDRVLNQWDIDQLKSAEADDNKPFGYTEVTPTEDSTMDQAKETEYKTQIATFTEQLATATGKIAAAEGRAVAAEAKVVLLEKEKVRGELASFCDAQIKAGKMLPATKKASMDYMESIAGQAAIDFTEGEGDKAKTVKKTPLEIYQATIEAGPKLVHFGEHARKEDAVDTAEADKLTQLTEDKMKADKSLTYSEASRQVLAENPDLNIAVDF